MRTIRYVVRVWSTTSRKWRTSYETSLRAAIALTWGLETLWTVVDNATGRYIAAHTQMLFEATKQWRHNARAFKQRLSYTIRWTSSPDIEAWADRFARNYFDDIKQTPFQYHDA